MAVEELSGLLRGSLMVGGSTIPSSYLLPDLFARFHESYPGVALQLVTGDSREVVEAVMNATVEVALVGAPPGNRDLLSDRIDSDQLVLILPPKHPRSGSTTWKRADLLECPLVMRENGSGTRSATDAALAKLLGDDVAGLKIACEVGSTEALKAAVRSGLGAAFVSTLAVRDELASGALSSARVKGFDVKRDFFLVSRKESVLSPAARAFRAIALGD